MNCLEFHSVVAGVSQLTAFLFNKYDKQREEKRWRVYSLNSNVFAE